MDIFFQDPDAIPLPPEEVRVKELRAEPWPDQRRVRVFLELLPFQKRPSGEVSITNPLGEAIASASIIESIVPRMEFNMHLRGEVPPGEYQLMATIYYEVEPNDPDTPPEGRERIVVDEKVTKFEIRD
jgi:hypothetical protein